MHSRAIQRRAIALLPGVLQRPIYHPRSLSPYRAIGPRLAHLVSPGAPSARLARARSSSRPSVSAHLRAWTRGPRRTLIPTAPVAGSRNVIAARIDVAQGHRRARKEPENPPRETFRISPRETRGSLSLASLVLRREVWSWSLCPGP